MIIYININNGVLQSSLIFTILFNLYINDLIKELNQNSYEILVYADDLYIIWRNKSIIKYIK